jgi:hypothetical protein
MLRPFTVRLTTPALPTRTIMDVLASQRRRSPAVTNASYMTVSSATMRIHDRPVASTSSVIAAPLTCVVAPGEAVTLGEALTVGEAIARNEAVALGDAVAPGEAVAPGDAVARGEAAAVDAAVDWTVGEGAAACEASARPAATARAG